MKVRPDKIEKLEELLNQYVDKDKKIIETKITRLTAPGENFGSTILKVDLILKNDHGEFEPLSVVAKLLPESEFFQTVFNVQVSFKMESAFYEVVVPTLQEFQREQEVRNVIDFFPRFYGSRCNLNGTEKIDGNAVLLLENLKITGFQNLDRHIGCDFESAKFILADLAKFHAVPLALKLLQPETFKEKVKKYMACFNPYDNASDGPPHQAVIEILEENEDCKHFVSKVMKSVNLWKPYISDCREPFSTLSHTDMWVNNFMVKLENGRVVHNKFVDFQAFNYESPVKDLLFFLFTSVQMNVLKENLDYLLRFYHKHFIKTLEELHCPIKEFSFEKYMDEIYYYGLFEIFHIIFFLMVVVLGKKGELPKNHQTETDGPPIISKDQVPLEVRKRMWWIVQEFGRRKWLGD